MKNKTTSSLGFFNYFKKIIGWHIYGYILLNFLVGLLDGLGLAMFIPLLALATGTEGGGESLGNLQFLVDLITKIGLELNLMTTLGFMVSLFLFKGVFYYLRSIYFIKIRLKTIRTVRIRLIEGLKSLSYSGFTKMEAGKLQNNMIGETGKLVGAMTFYFNTMQHIVMVMTYVVLAFSANWKFAVMVGLGGVITNIFYKYINKITQRYARKQSLLGHDFNGDLIQVINHFKYLKATTYFKAFEKKLQDNIWMVEEISFRIGRIGSIAESLREPLIIVVISGVILFQVNVMGGDFSSILVSLLLFYRALAHLASMQNAWNGFLTNSAGLESIETLLLQFTKYKELQYSENIEEIGEIKVENVSVKYDSKEVLKEVTFSIPKKTSVAFVGESGAGKTTLANVICGLMTPNQGSVWVSGKSVYASDLDSYRKRIGYITQEPVVFNDTIFNNVTFWAEKTEEALAKFHKIMEMVSLKDFMEGLNQKEDTVLGHNGILISGGQKQRISIARELYKDVELMILDEATSALDSETEKHIKESIDMLQGKFTMIIIAHRLSTVKNVDQVYLMEKGEIINHGTFSELLNKSERFRKMVELQEVG
ncbi:ABC transporter ATP-binding protein [Riemerella anatipestifer]|nr:ABC transporter ATP-binding protein [Riemerella anatipestifer]MDY3324256.1 ABC transporter ATP-binding protein [Riemerella anatipestifer]MDY3353071.1 ABC transporter ATP-binding protein [Riemerella anatipestifer]